MRHAIAGRFGTTDSLPIKTDEDEQLTQFSLVTSNKRLDHDISSSLDFLAKHGVCPTEVALDLLILAVHVHAADTRISRSSESQDSWTREIRLVVPVLNVPLWESTAALLARMLNFLTGDRWTVEFRPRPKGCETIVTSLSKNAPKHDFDRVNLFSGGLDSLIGAVDALESGGSPLFVSHAGEGATSDAQTKLFAGLIKAYPQATNHRLRAWVSFPTGLVANVSGEDTTRGRSFLFFALGVVAGSGFGTAFSLNAPENGLIALNPPLDSLRLGALSTRTTHPFYMARWNDLLSGLGIQGSVANPYWNKTKGEMVLECSNRKILEALLPLSLSCASPSKGRWAGHSTKHCGYCLPCLIRRAAVIAGMGKDATEYSTSLDGGSVLDTSIAEGKQARSFQFAIDRLRRCPEDAAILVHKTGPLSDETDERQAALADVYSRGLYEVAALLDNITTAPSK